MAQEGDRRWRQWWVFVQLVQLVGRVLTSSLYVGDSESIMSEKAKEKSELDEGEDERRPPPAGSQAHEVRISSQGYRPMLMDVPS